MFRTRSHLLVLALGFLLPWRLQAAPQKGTPWLTNYHRAMSESRKQNKLVLAYFSGSDWDPWCQKLDSEVLETDLFRQWAARNVVLLRLDFPKEKRLSSTLRQQNERLKERFSVSKTPTFVLLNPSGEPIARAGYDEARLREDERKGEPKAWIAYLENVLKNRPPEEQLARHGDFAQSVAYAKSRFGIVVLLITHGHIKYAMDERDLLMKDQQFIKFVNRNVTFVDVEWPDDVDTSQPAQAFRSFAASHKIATVPFQIVLWDAPLDQIKARIFAFDPNRTEELVSRIQAQLPHVDYTGGWITDYNAARTIASQQDRYIFLVFTRMEGAEWSRKMDQEIFETDEFKQYARKHLVLVRIDFSEAATQPEMVAAENKRLADLFNIRGFPTVAVVNPLGQKLVESKYMKGGPGPFLSELSPIIQHDIDRRAALKD